MRQIHAQNTCPIWQNVEVVSRTRLVRCLPLLSVLALLTATGLAGAQESTHGDEPAPDSVEDLEVRFGAGAERFARGTPLFPWYREWTKDADPFFRDTELSLRLRSFYLDSKNLDNTDDLSWANGGSLYYRSGQAFDALSVEAEYFSSIRAVGDEGEDTLLLRPGQTSFGVLGQLNARLEFDENSFTGYRQRLELPYLNVRDSRMVPNTFEAYYFEGRTGDLEYAAGYVDKIKVRNSNRFVSMPERLGVQSRRGLLLAGARYTYAEGSTIGAINHYVDDVLNIFYGEATHLVPVSDELQLRFGAQFTDQRSVGDDRLTGQHFQTSVLGTRVAASYRSAILSFAFSTTDEDRRIVSPWGSYPGYIGLIQRDFNRAGEEAWLVGLSYEFSRLGLDGLSTFVNYASGRNATDSDGLPDPDQTEFDVTMDYRVPGELFEGLWIRLRASFLDKGATASDYRVILNYEVPIF